MIGALILGLVAGAVARVLMPSDIFSGQSGAQSWLISLLLGLVGAMVGYFIFTAVLGIGDNDMFDLGGLIGAIIGTMIVIAIANWLVRRRTV